MQQVLLLLQGSISAIVDVFSVTDLQKSLITCFQISKLKLHQTLTYPSMLSFTVHQSVQSDLLHWCLLYAQFGRALWEGESKRRKGKVGGRCLFPTTLADSVAYVREARLLNADTWLVGLLISFSTIDPVRQVGAPGDLGEPLEGRPLTHFAPPCIAGVAESAISEINIQAIRLRGG